MRAIDADKLFAAFEDADWFDNADRDIAEDMLLDAPVVNQTEQPDPDTGLVPCGCGGKAHVYLPVSVYSLYIIGCEKCRVRITFPNKVNEAKNEWNTAMGYKEADE